MGVYIKEKGTHYTFTDRHAASAFYNRRGLEENKKYMYSYQFASVYQRAYPAFLRYALIVEFMAMRDTLHASWASNCNLHVVEINLSKINAFLKCPIL